MAVDPAPAPAPPNLFTDGIEIIDVEDESKAPTPSLQTPAKVASSTPPVYPGGFAIDVCFEASKLPLDVAIFNSARAAGGDDKIRKYLQAVLVIGGTAHVPGMGHALESRYIIYIPSPIMRDCLTGVLPSQAPGYCDTFGAKHGKGADNSSPEGS
jgi:actin-related protein 8